MQLFILALISFELFKVEVVTSKNVDVKNHCRESHIAPNELLAM